MKFKSIIVNEAGYLEAIEGLSLSYGTTIEKAKEASLKLYNKDGGHNKFLESIQMWIKVTAPRYWWQEFDTYRIGMTKQSDSTMHTIMKKELTQDNFEYPIPEPTLTGLNATIGQYKQTETVFDKEDGLNKEELFKTIKNNLPEGFLQTRIVNLNYKTLRNIISQRKNHRLEEWKYFVNVIRYTAKHKEYIEDLFKEKVYEN